MLRILHLSDLHAKPYDKFDRDVEQRRELVAFCNETLRDQIAFILITGDIANRAKAAEYEQADNFIAELLQALNLDRKSVGMVPGNHDVDRDAARDNSLIADMQLALRTLPVHTAVEKFIDYLRNPEIADLLLRPFLAFNAFAEKYYSKSLATEKLFWSKSLPLNDGSNLVIQGMNSSVACSERDDTHPRELFLGTFQCPGKPDAGQVILTASHHPFTHIRDSNEATDILYANARIYVTGHEHRQRAHPVAQGLEIFAGALHPHRREPGWSPTFDVIELEVSGFERRRRLSVSVRRFKWDDEARTFIRHDVNEDHEINLANWITDKVNGELTGIVTLAKTEIAPPHTPQIAMAAGIDASLSAEDLVGSFLEASDADREAVIAEFKLNLEPFADSETELLNIFTVAANQGKLLELLSRLHDRKDG